MGRWLEVIAMVVLADALVLVVLSVIIGDASRWRVVRAVARTVRRSRRPRPVEVVRLRRPIEEVGADLRRLHASFHREGMRFAKYEGCRQAYDRVLAEAADMLELAHLLTVLPPGSERDRERERVEMVLENAGLLPYPFAA